MKCPRCEADTRVVDTVISPQCIHRKRECISCGTRFVTKETVTYEPMPSRWKKYGYGYRK